ncbi:PBP1A family penicillin-binding protein [Gammaproteobacteria bacterium]|nr:PBP1A family penicillin-binding protein [Gammaproteobacteria bacterium]
MLLNLKRYFSWMLNRRLGQLLLIFLCLVVMTLSSLNIYIDSKLPNEELIRNIELQIPLKIYSSDKKLIGEFGEKRRTALKFGEIPTHYVNAVLAAEDDDFFSHSGVSYTGLLRSVYRLVKAGRIQGGGSTITMQVAGNYLTSRDVSLFRKVKDIFLAYRLEETYTKEEIFEFYVNRIFFGNRAYGIAAASEVYYGKSLTQLNLAQWAMIAALPKAPSSINPLVNPSRALIRRNWILKRMLDLEYIHPEQFELAVNASLTANYFGLVSEVKAPYVAEEVRRYMIQEYGLKAYSEGLEVFTTIDSKFQNSATKAVKEGLESYDRRHGFRQPKNISNLFPANFFRLPKKSQLLEIESFLNADSIDTVDEKNLSEVFKSLESYIQNKDRFLAVVINPRDTLEALTKTGKIINISWSDELSWARPYISENRRGTKPRGFEDILKEGDLIWLKRDVVTNNISVTQVPEAQSALISLEANTGSILALVGGYDFFLSKFNRAEQASPLLGSNFKPFLYAAAFSEGFTPATLINDAPIIFEDDALEEKWKPRNASGKFFGPTRLREGLLQSRNLVSVRLLREVGVNKVREYAEKFGFDKQRLPADLSLSLGTASLNPLTNAAAYAVFANGGKKIEPYVIDRIVDRAGKILFKKQVKETRQVIDSRIAFIITDILKEAAARGTAKKISALNRKDFAGKTGTTNKAESTWFTGYNEKIVTSVWMGFDQPKSLGDREFGSSTALPIWMDYKKEIIDLIPITNTMPPQGLSIVKIDRVSGGLASDESSDPIFEYFLEENLPN